MGRLEFIEDGVEAWERIADTSDTSSFSTVQKVVWGGRLAEALLERAAVAAGWRRRGDYEVLALMRRSEPEQLTPVDVADRLLTSPSGMTGRIDRLEEQGHITREPDLNDRRIVRLGLTEDGRATVDDAFKQNLRLYQSILDSLDASEIKVLDDLLDKVVSRLDELTDMRRPWRD